MEPPDDIFLNNFQNSSSEKILNNVKNGEWDAILNGLCFTNGNCVMLNYMYFKHIGNNETYGYILNYITNNIDKVLELNNEFIVCVNMKTLTVIDVDKHKDYIKLISEIFKTKYPDKLAKCYVYNAPYIFSQIFNIVSMFIDKETQRKMVLVNV